MKTKKYSSSKVAIMALVLSFVFSAFVSAQFVPPTATNAQTAEEMRVNASTTYTLNGHTAGETYRWAVVGGTITEETTTVGDSSIYEGALNVINVTWDQDLPAVGITSTTGVMVVQKYNVAGCPSELQVLDVTKWNQATGNMNLTGLTPGVCSGDPLGFTVPVNVTGAPSLTSGGFEVAYTYTDVSGNLRDGLGLALTAGGTATGNTAIVGIPLPAGIINTGTADATLTVTMTSMVDAFDDGGSLGATTTYDLIVYATPSTGDIQSGTSLNRVR